MANLITKFKYYKPKSAKHKGNYVKYVATREGVEKLPKNNSESPVTKNQINLIEKIIKDLNKPITEKPFIAKSLELKDFETSIKLRDEINELKK